jgi:hypothetical protein
VGQDLPHSIFLQDLENLLPQIEIGTQFHMITAVPGNRLEENIQGLGHLGYWRSILQTQIFLLKDEATQSRTQEFPGGVAELASEDLGIEIGWIFLVLTTPSQFRGSYYLGDFEEKDVFLLQILLISLESLEGLRGLAPLIPEGTIKGEVDLQDREVVEILVHALQGENFFSKGLFPHHLGARADAAKITLLSVDLPQPAGISVASRAQLYLGDGGHRNEIALYQPRM